MRKPGEWQNLAHPRTVPGWNRLVKRPQAVQGGRSMGLKYDRAAGRWRDGGRWARAPEWDRFEAGDDSAGLKLDAIGRPMAGGRHVPMAALAPAAVERVSVGGPQSYTTGHVDFEAGTQTVFSHGMGGRPTDAAATFGRVLDASLAKGPFEADEVLIQGYGAVFRPDGMTHVPRRLENDLRDALPHDAKLTIIDEDGQKVIRVSMGEGAVHSAEETREGFEAMQQALEDVYDMLDESWMVDWWEYFDSDSDLYEDPA